MIASSTEAAADSPRASTSLCAVEVEGLSVQYGDTLALDDLSMHVPWGSIYGLIGPKGAGKSTVLRVLATLREPDGGRATIDGIDVEANPAAIRARIGYLPDASGVYENLTVSEYLAFFAGVHGISRIRRRHLVDELLELIDLGDRRHEPVGTLSRGMRQQLGIARCLIADPPILLLDEPAAGMDPRSRIELRDILGELGKLGKTIVLSSNVLSEISGLCTHLGVLREGEMVAEGSIEDIEALATTTPRLRLRLLDPAGRSAAAQLLEARPGAAAMETLDDRTLLLPFSGTEKDLPALLANLLSQGAPVVEVSLERPALEDIFFRLTEAEEEQQ